MAVAYISEFVDLAVVSTMPTALPIDPSTDQTVAITAGSVQSTAFATGTKLVRLHVDAICSVKFGTNPTATATSRRMAAGQTEYFAVPPGASFKVAVITNT